MAQPARIDFAADRGLAFDETITRVGADFTGAAMRMQVRTKPDVSGTPLISLTSSGGGLTLVYGGTDTVAHHVSAGRLDNTVYTVTNPATGAKYAAADSVALSVVAIHIVYTAMSYPNMPFPEERGDDLPLAWDMLIGGGSVGYEHKWFYGAFTVRGTVTQ